MQTIRLLLSVEEELRYQAEKFYVLCEVCGENLGDHRPYFAQEHLKKFSAHKKYSVRVKEQR